MKCKHAMLKLSAVLMALSFTAQADVFRCEIGGRTTYTDQPSKGCASVAIRDEPADPEALLRARRNREAYEQSMAQWREHYLRDIELRAAADKRDHSALSSPIPRRPNRFIQLTGTFHFTRLSRSRRDSSIRDFENKHPSSPGRLVSAWIRQS